MLRGRAGKIHSWVYHKDEMPLAANSDVILKKMPEVVYVQFENADWPESENGFASMIRNIDRDVGRMLAQLKTLGLDENTIVIFPQ